MYIKVELMTDPEKEELIKKLRAGICSDEDLERIRTLMPEWEPWEFSMILDLLWDYRHRQPGLSGQQSERVYQRISAGLDQRDDPRLSKDTTPRRRFSLLRPVPAKVWLVAASLAFLLGLGWWQFSGDHLQHFSTGNGQQMSITLPDHSEVQLNANSSLSYSERWEDGQRREVYLQGEAFFSVEDRSASGQKFAVITPDLTVEVLGTVFNVNSRQHKTAVFLQEGKIALQVNESEQGPKIMNPGEVLTFSKQEGQILSNERAVSPEFFTSWKDGVLIFESIPLDQVLEKLEQIYGIQFRVKDSLQYQRELRAALPIEELETLIPILEQTLGLEIRKTGEYYLIQ